MTDRRSTIDNLMSIARHRFESSIKDIAQNRQKFSRNTSIDNHSTAKQKLEKHRDSIYRSMADSRYSSIDIHQSINPRSADMNRFDSYQSMKSIDQKHRSKDELLIDDVYHNNLDTMHVRH